MGDSRSAPESRVWMNSDLGQAYATERAKRVAAEERLRLLLGVIGELKDAYLSTPWGWGAPLDTLFDLFDTLTRERRSSRDLPDSPAACPPPEEEK